jgi:hypothetical protein
MDPVSLLPQAISVLFFSRMWKFTPCRTTKWRIYDVGMTTRDDNKLTRASVPPECQVQRMAIVSFSGSPRLKSWLGDQRSWLMVFHWLPLSLQIHQGIVLQIMLRPPTSFPNSSQFKCPTIRRHTELRMSVNKPAVHKITLRHNCRLESNQVPSIQEGDYAQ